MGEEQPGENVQLALLEYRMTALEKRQETDTRNLRVDFQNEAKEMRAALARRDTMAIGTLGAAVIAMVGIIVDIILKIHQ